MPRARPTTRRVLPKGRPGPVKLTTGLKPLVTMRKALSDKKLLGATLSGPSWDTWRCFLIALMGEPLTKQEREVFAKFTGGRAKEPDEPVDEGAFVVGRRGGKDRAASIIASYIAGLCDHSNVLVPGERGVVMCIAPDQRQARITLGYIEATFKAASILAKLISNRTADTLELTNGVSVEVRAASFRRIRGVTALAIVGSEVAFWHDNETSSNPDVEILNACRPALATTGGPLILISSPYARRGSLWDVYKQHYGPAGDPRILVVQAETKAFNPSLRQSVIDRAYQRDPVAAAAEYGAEFRSDLEAFVSREAIDGVTISGCYELPPKPGIVYSGFLDPSGGRQDSMVLAVAHRDVDGCTILDCVRERPPPFSPANVVSEFAQVLKSYKLSKAQSDRYAGDWVTEPFRLLGITIEPSELSKSEIYVNTLPLINSSMVELLDLSRLHSQLCGLERRTSRLGKDSIDHAPGAHDDVANAVAGAILLASGKSKQIIVSQATREWAKQPNNHARRPRGAISANSINQFNMQAVARSGVHNSISADVFLAQRHAAEKKG
jgi:hypothetical protein